MCLNITFYVSDNNDCKSEKAHQEDCKSEKTHQD